MLQRKRCVPFRRAAYVGGGSKMRPSPASGQRIPCQYYPSARKFLRFTIARERSAGHVAQEILVWCLRNNYTFAAMDFGRRLGARCFRTGTRAYPEVDL